MNNIHILYKYRFLFSVKNFEIWAVDSSLNNESNSHLPKLKADNLVVVGNLFKPKVENFRIMLFIKLFG